LSYPEQLAAYAEIWQLASRDEIADMSLGALPTLGKLGWCERCHCLQTFLKVSTQTPQYAAADFWSMAAGQYGLSAIGFAPLAMFGEGGIESGERASAVPGGALGSNAGDSLGPLQLFKIRLSASRHVVSGDDTKRSQSECGSADLLCRLTYGATECVGKQLICIVVRHAERLARLDSLLKEASNALRNIGRVIVE
jgi:hypothetical protein